MRHLYATFLVVAICTLIAEEPAPKPEPNTVAVNQHGLTLHVPADWIHSKGISPRISVWREVADKGQVTHKAISLTVGDSRLDIEQQVKELTTIITDLYSESVIHQTHISSNNTIGHPFIDYQYSVGPTTWRQMLLFIHHAKDQSQPALILVLSGPVETWGDWKIEREHILKPLR